MTKWTAKVITEIITVTCASLWFLGLAKTEIRSLYDQLKLLETVEIWY